MKLHERLKHLISPNPRHFPVEEKTPLQFPKIADFTNLTAIVQHLTKESCNTSSAIFFA
jgi:hypothetical protein